MAEEKRDKQFYEQRASDEMARHFLSVNYDVRQKLALAGRMLRARPGGPAVPPEVQGHRGTFNYFARQILRDQGDAAIR